MYGTIKKLLHNYENQIEKIQTVKKNINDLNNFINQLFIDES